MGAVSTRLAAKAGMTPATGYNLVGVDDFEDPGDELYLISSHDTRTEAEAALRLRKAADSEEVVHIYGSRDRARGSTVGENTEKSMDAIDSLNALSKGFPPAKGGKGNNVNDATDTKPSGASKMAPQGGSAGAKGAPPKPGNAGEGPQLGADKGKPGEEPPPKPVKPGEGAAGDMATAGEDPEKGSVQYPTKVKDPTTGEFTFVYLEEAERDENARFVVSPETAEGAHWEVPHHGEDYEAFKQWKSARKKGLEGTQIPKELVDGAVRHAEKHHFDGGPHKAAFDDHQAHQGESGDPEAPPSHAAANGGPPADGQSHSAMGGGDDKGAPPAGGKAGPPGNAGQGDKPADAKQKPDLIGKLAQFAMPHEPKDSDTAGGIPSGSSRSGTEHATSGEQMESDEDAFEQIYGKRSTLKLSGDPISALGDLVKAKYTKRTRGADGKWKYEYGDRTARASASKEKPTLSEAKDKVAAALGVPSYKVSSQTYSAGNVQLVVEGGDRAGQVKVQRALPGARVNLIGSRIYVDEWDRPAPAKTLEIDFANPGRTSRAPYYHKSEGPQFVQRGDSYDSMRKSLYTFNLTDRGTGTKISDVLLFDYLCAFIEEAHEQESREVQHRNPVAGEDFYENFAQPVMSELVQYIPLNPNLARAAAKYKITVASIAAIMKQKGMIKPPTDGQTDHGDKWSSDLDSMNAMGLNERQGPTGEVLMTSDARYDVREEPDAKRDLVLSKGPEMVQFGYDGHEITGLVGRASQANIHGRYADVPMVKANYDPSCLKHGDIHSANYAHEAFVKCSCPG